MATHWATVALDQSNRAIPLELRSEFVERRLIHWDRLALNE